MDGDAVEAGGHGGEDVEEIDALEGAEIFDDGANFVEKLSDDEEAFVGFLMDFGGVVEMAHEPEIDVESGEMVAGGVVEIAGDGAEGGLLGGDEFAGEFAALVGEFVDALEESAVGTDDGDADAEDEHEGEGEEERL